MPTLAKEEEEEEGTMKSIKELLFSHSRDYLLNVEREKVKYEDGIKGKVVGLLMGPHWLPNQLLEAISTIAKYKEDLDKGTVFVLVTSNRDETMMEVLGKGSPEVDNRADHESFMDFLRKMPKGWLAIPFEDEETRTKLTEEYSWGTYSLAFIGPDGRSHTVDGFGALDKWGAEGFPFTDERFHEIAIERAANQTLASLLAHKDRDYVISNTGAQVKIAELEGKIVALYFSAHWCPPCQQFTPLLVDIYKKLKKMEVEFEVVFISSDEDEKSFNMYFQDMPWLAIPFSDEMTKKILDSTFEVEGIPSLVILDAKGKTSQEGGVEIMYKYGTEAYPFTKERLDTLKQEEATLRASQTLEKLLVHGDLDFIISHGNQQVNVSSLQGKTLGLYFSAHWCLPCQSFTPNLVSVYNSLKASGKAFEVVFVSSDKDEEAFKGYYKTMPWLALPHGDKRKKHLSRYFDVEGIPALVIIGPDGKTITHDGDTLIDDYGERGFPFTQARLEELEAELDTKMQKLPKTASVVEHEHPLILAKNPYGTLSYVCDICTEIGKLEWAYHCEECGFDLHPACAVNKEENEEEEEGEYSHEHTPPLQYVCKDDVCTKVL